MLNDAAQEYGRQFEIQNGALIWTHKQVSKAATKVLVKRRAFGFLTFDSE